MGKNYYIVCNCCGKEIHHIGKQSAGWNFKSNITKDDFIKMPIHTNQVIKDEYGRIYTKEELIKSVSDKWELSELTKDAWDNVDLWC